MLVVYVGQFRTDVDSASLQRVMGVSAALARSGAEVLIGGQGRVGRRETAWPRVTLDGFGVIQRDRTRVERILSGHGLREWLAGLTRVPDVVVVYGGTGRFTHVVKKWSREHSVPRVIDSVEWYDRRHLPGGRFGLKALDNEVSMRRRYCAYDGAIAISRLLEEHYSRRGTRVVRIPPIMDVRSMHPGQKTSEGPLRLAYAGSPGWKDDLATLVRALARVDPSGEKVCLDVAGATETELLGLPGMPETMPACVRAFGRMPREDALALVGRADYVPLVRPDLRYANAGFPTKVVEAMALGTAVLANHTSDLHLHVRNGETGLQVSSGDLEHGVVSALETAIRGGKIMARRLGVNAREEALRSFDQRRYSTVLRAFMDRVVIEGALR